MASNDSAAVASMTSKLSSASCKAFSRSSTPSNAAVQRYSCPCDDPRVGKIEAKKFETEAEVSEKFRKEKKSLWQTTVEESEERDAPHIALVKEREKKICKDVDSAADYLDGEIFPILLPGMEKMLREARRSNALAMQKCRFNGLDYLAEYLWNKNPRWPRRNLEWLEDFEIPRFKLCMRLNPRPIFPKSWLWSAEEAALLIQRWVRGWLVRKNDDVQELRQFWKTIANEKQSLDENFFASPRNSHELDICERWKFSARKQE